MERKVLLSGKKFSFAVGSQARSGAFTLIELLVIASHHCCDRLQDILKKIKTKRMSFSPAHGQVKLYSFTLIELLVSKTCQICVLSLYYLKKRTKKCLIMLAKQALHAPTGRFIFSTGKCFILLWA